MPPFYRNDARLATFATLQRDQMKRWESMHPFILMRVTSLPGQGPSMRIDPTTGKFRPPGRPRV